MNGHPAALASAVLGVALFSASAHAVEAQPPADPSKPVTTVRVGGSPADQDFRAAQQISADRYRKARTECRAKPADERSACTTAARAELKRARLEAKAAHDAAKKKPKPP